MDVLDLSGGGILLALTAVTLDLPDMGLLVLRAWPLHVLADRSLVQLLELRPLDMMGVVFFCLGIRTFRLAR